MLVHLSIDSAVDCLEVVFQPLRDHLILKGEVRLVQPEKLIVAEVRLSGMLYGIIGVGKLLIVIFIKFVDGRRNEEDGLRRNLQLLLHQLL